MLKKKNRSAVVSARVSQKSFESLYKKSLRDDRSISFIVRKIIEESISKDCLLDEESGTEN